LRLLENADGDIHLQSGIRAGEFAEGIAHEHGIVGDVVRGDVEQLESVVGSVVDRRTVPAPLIRNRMTARRDN
jgi:hypothetical protein